MEFGNLYKFTCVRNPWDRMVSYYFTPTQNTSAWDRKKFRKAIVKVLPVADYLRLDKGKGDPFANVNYIMRFENLADDFRAVCAALDISPAPLPRYNRSNREHYSKYYDDELRELVARAVCRGDRAFWIYVRAAIRATIFQASRILRPDGETIPVISIPAATMLS